MNIWKRAICWSIDHQWEPPLSEMTDDAPPTRCTCRRCGYQVDGVLLRQLLIAANIPLSKER